MNPTDFYDEGEITMENNALDLSRVEASIEKVCREKYLKGREQYGTHWVGERGAIECLEELIDGIVYLSLEQKALLVNHNEEDEMPKKMKARNDVLEKLTDDIRGCVSGVLLYIRMTKDDHQWDLLFPSGKED
jgi:hypothetical protein